MGHGQTLTLSEAGYVLDRSPTDLNKAVDTGMIRARQRKVGKAVQRLVGPAELRFFVSGAARPPRDFFVTGRHSAPDSTGRKG